MGLWTRVKRSMRALFGGIVEKTEDPELILQQTIRDMRDRIPDLNNSVAQVMATEKLLAKNKERLESQVVDLDSKIKASVKMGRDDIATAYIGQLSQAQVDLQKTGHQFEHAQLESKQARLQEQLAQTMEAFNLGDDASTFNEMRDKIDRRAAAAEAKMQLGSASVDNQMQEIEREAMDMQLQDKLLQYKRDMGLLPAAPFYRRLVERREKERARKLRDAQREAVIKGFDPREREAVEYLRWMKNQIYSNYKKF